ncbi:MAG: aldehyde dehydrogenase family protein [Clostridiales bacterium]|nr:aldehyde dehydrogenase family protein [Clostridiales bacterium]
MKNNSLQIDQLISQAAETKAACAATVSAHRNLALSFLSEAVSTSAGRLVSANEEDLQNARARGLDQKMIEEMRLDYIGAGALSGRISHMASAADPTDEHDVWHRENAMTVECLRVPLGVVLIIAGASPKKTLECIASCMKTGNAVILLQSEVTPATDQAMLGLLNAAFACCGLRDDWVTPIKYSTESLSYLLKQKERIDAAVLLGSKAQNALLRQNTDIPIIESEYGANHIYVDEGADLAAAVSGIIASKNSLLPATVNTVLVNWMISDGLLPALEGLAMAAGIELIGDARIRSTLHGITEADESANIDAGNRLLLLTVNSLSEALAHIQKYSAGLCEGIYADKKEHIDRFCRLADAGIIAVNTPFVKATGFEIGLGAELGFSANKLGARGPAGLARLTTTKYIIKEQA